MPGHVFLSAFVVADSGDLIHRYRKLQCADVWGNLPDTTPGSVYSRYLDIYGDDSLFPVARTPLGNLATMICFDQAHPEIPRLLALEGAEVLLHPSAEGFGDATLAVPWEAARRTRAWENTAYVLSAMPGGEFIPGAEGPGETILRGYSTAVRFDGTVLARAHTVGTAAVSAPIDLRALRQARADPARNLLVWDDPAAYAHAYRAEVGLPNDLWGDDPDVYPYEGMKPSRDVLTGYNARGIFVQPEVATADPRRDVEIPIQ
jgi:predicted amidohydrolase